MSTTLCRNVIFISFSPSSPTLTVILHEVEPSDNPDDTERRGTCNHCDAHRDLDPSRLYEGEAGNVMGICK